jgi:hypothetical protein
MGGEKADFCFTDPPYNVGKIYTEDTDDNKTKQDFILWCGEWLEYCPRPLLLTVGVKRLLWWEVITGEPDWTLAWVKRTPGACQASLISLVKMGQRRHWMRWWWRWRWR